MQDCVYILLKERLSNVWSCYSSSSSSTAKLYNSLFSDIVEESKDPERL